MYNVKRNFPRLAPKLVFSFAVIGTLAGGFDRYWKITFSAALPAENVLFLPSSATEKVLLLAQCVLLVAVLMLVGHWIRQRSYASALALWWVAVGGASNLFDRVQLGFVIDYWRMELLGSALAYNCADILIVVGVATLFFISLKRRKVLYGSKNS